MASRAISLADSTRNSYCRMYLIFGSTFMNLGRKQRGGLGRVDRGSVRERESKLSLRYYTANPSLLCALPPHGLAASLWPTRLVLSRASEGGFAPTGSRLPIFHGRALKGARPPPTPRHTHTPHPSSPQLPGGFHGVARTPLPWLPTPSAPARAGG
eukprot:CAMPEP_0113700222 /NCGR_PEP_ID=MMETSP0038_2-20120614/23818_1 /TAXON_ID=2898 /ORGANISM="Cryptomonas paramecium" /LENGTH=155 /DNA_ID=CAMNT_0000623817 /DNA_START=428 /DNA_END=892 /DNA_ORIENTATION=+ /assembly_acc=CAM_ASM_000170